MNKVILVLTLLIFLTGTNGFAQNNDVSIDSSGNVAVGTSAGGNLEVTGASAERAISGKGIDTGGAGVYGENTTGSSTNYGILGHDQYGVFGYSSGGYAGYFSGDARVTGNLTVNGSLSGEADPEVGTLTSGRWCTSNGTQVNCTSNAPVTSEADPVFSGSAASGITSILIGNWNAAYGWGNHASAGYDTTNDSWIGMGNVYMTSGNVGIGTSSPSEKLTVAGTIESTSGGIKFPDGSVQSTSGAPLVVAQIPRTNSTSTVDSSEEIQGEYNSITIGTDGLPIISYYGARLHADLMVAKCTDASCSSATINTVDSTGKVGEYTSITIGTGGYPVISYSDGTNSDLKIAECANAACSSATINTVDSSGGEHTSVTVGTDGYPVISYYGANRRLKVAKCNNSPCSSATINNVTFGGSSDWGEFSSIIIGIDALPIISFYDRSNSSLKVAKCTNAACSSTTINTVETAASPGTLGQYTSITIGIDGLPVISYYDARTANYDLKVAKCTDISCSSANTYTIDSAGDVGQYTSITIGMDGFPVVSYFDATNYDLKVAKCTDASCSSANTYTIDSAGDVGQYTSITIGVDGSPVISYFYNDTSSGTGNLKAAKCANAFCINNWVRR